MDWREFARVESSKILLTLLIVFFVVRHMPESYILAAWSALLILVDARRYPRKP